MKLSYFTMPLHPPGRDYSATLHEDRAAFLLADELGFAEAFCGEHVTDRAETITSCLIFLASLAYQTRRIKLGSGTVNLPNAHPAAVAAQVAMLDHMLAGRFIFGISPGGLRSDAEVFGNLDKDRRAMFAEAIEQVLAIWSGTPPYDLNGEFWQISTRRTMDLEIGQGAIVPPLQRPHPPIMVASMSPFADSVAQAAARGWSIISANFLQPVWVASHRAKLVEGWAGAARPFNFGDWRVAKSIFVADDEKTARAYAMNPAGPYGNYYRSLMRKLIGNGRPDLFKNRADMADADVTHDFVMESLVICGTPAQVAERILALRDEVGEFGTLVYAGHDWEDVALSRRSMELMAREVMPMVNRALGETME
ncbi:MAG: LLM class flavin-dependent oxidoreductase [Proteobacteria bacterium]|nr:LLM class flavin-dependent oxidoreductase [Pseudomonadota bacterium]